MRHLLSLVEYRFVPFTPLHFGLGALGKAALGPRFSFSLFAGTQVLMDLEPGIKMLAGWNGPLHGPTHTIAGAVIIAMATIVLAEAWQQYGPASLLRRFGKSTRGVLVGSALFGSLSHVFLDALMHADMALHADLRRVLGPAIDGARVAELACLSALLAAPVVWVFRYVIGRRIREQRLSHF